MKTLKVKSNLIEIDTIRRFLEKNLRRLNFSEEEHYKIELAVVEVCTNIIMYAYPQGQGEISLKTSEQEGELFIEIRDSGIPFDPTKAEEPNIEEIIRENKRGGVGIYLSRRFMDSFVYRREDNQNILTMSKKIKGN